MACLLGEETMARRTKSEAMETRDAILDAASHIFYEKGVAKASLNEIAERAGVTRGAVYWHFKNKVDLFIALHDALYEPFMETVLQDLEKNHAEPLKQLEELCVNVLVELDSNEKKKRILSVFYLKCDYTGEMAQVLKLQEKQKENSRKLFDHYFERAIAKGHIACPVSAHNLSIGLWCYLTGIVQEYLRFPGIINLGLQSPQLMLQYFYGLHAR